MEAHALLGLGSTEKGLLSRPRGPGGARREERERLDGIVVGATERLNLESGIGAKSRRRSSRGGSASIPCE